MRQRRLGMCFIRGILLALCSLPANREILLRPLRHQALKLMKREQDQTFQYAFATKPGSFEQAAIATMPAAIASIPRLHVTDARHGVTPGKEIAASLTDGSAPQQAACARPPNARTCAGQSLRPCPFGRSA